MRCKRKRENYQKNKSEIADLRWKVSKKLSNDPDGAIEKELYFELRQNGASQTTAGRIIYFDQEAKDFFLEKDRCEPRHILIEGSPPEASDAIINISRNVLNKFCRKLEKEWMCKKDKSDLPKTKHLGDLDLK